MNGCSPEVPFRTGSDRTGQPAVVSLSGIPAGQSAGRRQNSLTCGDGVLVMPGSRLGGAGLPVAGVSAGG